MSAIAATSSHIARDVLAYLRDHRGEKYSAVQLGELTGHPSRLVNKILCARAVDFRYKKLHRERRTVGDRAMVYWFHDPEAAAGTGSNVRVIVRWMMRNTKAAIPSVIAQATGIHVGAVAAELQRMADAGSAVRCELLTRTGLDRFEYRLSHCPEGLSPGRTTRSFVEHRA